MRIVLTFAMALALASPALADGWNQYPGNPVLSATEPWEGSGVHEPTVLRIGGRYVMYYNAGNWFRDQAKGLRCAVGVAFSSDGLHWQKWEGNPVLGQWAGGVASACHNHALYHGGRVYVFFSGPNGDLYVASSDDGLHFTTQAGAVLSVDGYVANSFVWTEGGAWRLLYEHWTGSPPPGDCGTWPCWGTSLARGLQPGGWQSAAQLSALGIGGMVGGPWIDRRGPVYRVYFHASANANLPTDIYYRDTTDFVSFGPAVEALGRTQPWEVDQVADPSIAGRFLYFDGDDNYGQFSAIGVAIPAPSYVHRYGD